MESGIFAVFIITVYRSGIIVFTILSISGLIIFALSAKMKSFTLACLGRAIYGMGAEAQNIWVATVVSIWFYYGELSFATAYTFQGIELSLL
jgi:hypothetical protein